MARAATGQIVERKRKAGTTFAIRFRAYGKREFITLGTRQMVGPAPAPRRS